MSSMDEAAGRLAHHLAHPTARACLPPLPLRPGFFFLFLLAPWFTYGVMAKDISWEVDWDLHWLQATWRLWGGCGLEGCALQSGREGTVLGAEIRARTW